MAEENDFGINNERKSENVCNFEDLFDDIESPATKVSKKISSDVIDTISNENVPTEIDMGFSIEQTKKDNSLVWYYCNLNLFCYYFKSINKSSFGPKKVQISYESNTSKEKSNI